jgi:hypothetical protein
MSDVEAILGLGARKVYSHNQLIAALSLAGLLDAGTAADVHIERSPLIAAPWQPQPLDMQDNVADWGVGTQL